jgi:hypothetical protein
MTSDDALFQSAVQALLRGDFSFPSRLEPLFTGHPCRIVQWVDEGRFAEEPAALAEALSCACFNGRTAVAADLMDRGVDPAAGNGTGMNAFHWAANRGQFETVRLLIARNAPLEIKNMYGGTVLATTVWSAVHERKPDHLAIVEALMAAGANVEEADYPSGDEQVDELLRRGR